jgi:hypothetical protein
VHYPFDGLVRSFVVMGQKLISWWEGLEGRTRVLAGIPIAFVVLFLFHQFFPLLSTGDRLLYAAMEAVPVALVMAWATQNELRRRADREQRIEDARRRAESADEPDA